MLSWVENIFYYLIYQKDTKRTTRRAKKRNGKRCCPWRDDWCAGESRRLFISSSVISMVWCIMLLLWQNNIKAARGWLWKDKKCALYHMCSEQMPPWELAIKHSLGLQTEIRVFQAIKLSMTVFSSPARLMLSSEAKLMLLVTERNIFVNDREACTASENH